jgi:hypothetical protein
MSATAPAPKDGGYAHVEVDVDRQVLLLIDDGGAIKRMLPVSTGSNKHYKEKRMSGLAYTPQWPLPNLFEALRMEKVSARTALLSELLQRWPRDSRKSGSASHSAESWLHSHSHVGGCVGQPRITGRDHRAHL